jgi:hypothetical protein
MATIVTRSGKGSPLTHTEGDANFTNLNNDKLENINSENLGDLSNVASTAPSNGQVLTYNTSNTQWEPQTAAGGGGGISRAVLQSGGNPALINSTTNTWTQQAWAWEELKDADNIVTTAGNAFTLSAGTYLLDINLGQMYGFAPNTGTVYWPVVALRNSSDSTYPWGWGGDVSDTQMSSTQSSWYHSGATVAFKAYFQIFGSKTFDIVYKQNTSSASFLVYFKGGNSDWDNNTAARSPGWIVIEKLA